MAAGGVIERVVASLTKEELKRARNVLGVSDDASASVLASEVEKYAEAAIMEYLDQFLGRALPTRFKDLQMLRLLRMSTYANGGRLLEPDRVADLFQITHAEAKTLVRNTGSRYRFELEGTLREVAWEAIGTTGSKDADTYRIVIRDAALLESLHDLVRRGPGYPTGIQGTAEMHVFSLDRQTMTALLHGLGHTVSELDSRIDVRKKRK
jgi:hypothetical protein